MGEYPVTLVTDGEAPNYCFELEKGFLTVEPIPMEILVESISKTHSAPDPNYIWKEKTGWPLPSKILPIQVTRDPGEHPGKYALHATCANPNYLLRHNPAYLEIKRVVPVVHHVTTEPMKAYQTFRETPIDYAMKDPETNELVPGELVWREYFQKNLDVPITSINKNIYTLLFIADDTDYYDSPVQVKVLFCMEKNKLTLKADDKTITYGDPIPELTYTIEEGELVPGQNVLCSYELMEFNSATPTPLPAGKYNIFSQSRIKSKGVFTEDCPYLCTKKSGILTVEKRTAYLIVEDKEYTWGEEVPEFTCRFALDPEGLEPVWEDLFPYLTYEYHLGETDASGQATISATGVLNSRNWSLKVVPGTLKCNPKTLTPQWPEDLHLNAWDALSPVTITADPAELPPGTASFSTTSEIKFPDTMDYSDWEEILTPDDEGYDKDKYIHTPLYTWQFAGVYNVCLASAETGDYRFRWDTSVPGRLTIGAKTILVTDDAESLVEGSHLTRKLYKSSDDTDPEVHVFTVGKDIFKGIYHAMRNILPGGTIWIDGDMGEIGVEDVYVKQQSNCTIRKIYSPYWDTQVILMPRIQSGGNYELNLYGLEMRNYIENRGNFILEDCTFRRTVTIYTQSSDSDSRADSTPQQIIRKCVFTREPWVFYDIRGIYVAPDTYALLLVDRSIGHGFQLTLEDCRFKWVQEKAGGCNIALFRNPQTQNYLEDEETTLTWQRNVLNWPLDLTSCTFEGWQEDDPEILKTHFLPFYEDDPVIKFLLPETKAE